VHVDAAALAHALILARAGRVDDTQQRLTSAVACEAVARGRCTAEGRERELLADRFPSVIARTAALRLPIHHAGLSLLAATLPSRSPSPSGWDLSCSLVPPSLHALLYDRDETARTYAAGPKP